MSDFTSLITDEQVLNVLRRLDEAKRNFDWATDDGSDNDPFHFADMGFSLRPQQGDFLYLLTRFGRPKVVVEFATSLGFSAIYLATAVRENGDGHVYGTELVPQKAVTARANIAEAGLGDLVTVLDGDARDTLAELSDPIDLLLVDGWPSDDDTEPSAALQVLRIVEERLRPGALIVNDNGETDYLDYIHTPANGYASLALPWKGSTEVSVRR